jgi:hypothetical protein
MLPDGNPGQWIDNQLMVIILGLSICCPAPGRTRKMSIPEIIKGGFLQ